MNPELIIEMLRVGAQLLSAMNRIKAQVQAEDPALWARIADDFNDAATEFNSTK